MYIEAVRVQARIAVDEVAALEPAGAPDWTSTDAPSTAALPAWVTTTGIRCRQ